MAFPLQKALVGVVSAFAAVLVVPSGFSGKSL